MLLTALDRLEQQFLGGVPRWWYGSKAGPSATTIRPYILELTLEAQKLDPSLCLDHLTTAEIAEFVSRSE